VGAPAKTAKTPANFDSAEVFAGPLDEDPAFKRLVTGLYNRRRG
jgi:hypothetical protein